eukprot:7845182-Alexandrium_andersonii.AAC.1
MTPAGLDQLRKTLRGAPEDMRQVAVGGMSTAALVWGRPAPTVCPDCGAGVTPTLDHVLWH